MIDRLYKMTDEELRVEKKWMEENKEKFYKTDFRQIMDEIEEAMSMTYEERKMLVWKKNIEMLEDFAKALRG